MNFKYAVKDTNDKFMHVIECIPKVFIDFGLVVLFLTILPIGYPFAVIYRMVKK